MILSQLQIDLIHQMHGTKSTICDLLDTLNNVRAQNIALRLRNDFLNEKTAALEREKEQALNQKPGPPPWRNPGDGQK